MKELGERSSQEMAPLTSVFFEDITEVNIKQDGLVEGSISPGSVILIDEKQIKVEEGGEVCVVYGSSNTQLKHSKSIPYLN